MKKINKISVIIPNYNSAAYIERCLDSIYRQNFSDFEVIFIDDGSNDHSIQVVEEYIKKNKIENLTVIEQYNMNASVARNNGMVRATGEYLLFLDSDDELCDGVLSIIGNIIKKDEPDLIIGNYIQIDSDSNNIGEVSYFSGLSYINSDDKYSNLSMLSPVPSNKVYSKQLIERERISWGNVRIGQDLNFYLKYLLCSDSIVTIDKPFYKYRIIDKSMSRTYDFKILDIVESMKNIRQFYRQKNKEYIYNEYLQVVELINYNVQLNKVKMFKKRYEKKIISKFLNYHENKINYSFAKNYHKQEKIIRIKFKIKALLYWAYK